MKASFSLLAVVGLAASTAAAQKWDNGTVYTTEVVTEYTTYCPGPTTIVQNNVTYTVSSATTLTITNCPCTITSALSATYNPPVGTGTGVVPETSTLVSTAPTSGPSGTASSGTPSSTSTSASAANAPSAYDASLSALAIGAVALLFL